MARHLLVAAVRAPTFDELKEELKAKIRQLDSKPGTHDKRHTLQAVVDLLEGDVNRFAKL